MSVKMQSGLFQKLLYVKEVLEAGKIVVAAEKNGIKSSNLSKLIKETESTLHTKIFYRTNNGVIPTQDGILLAKIAEDMQNLMNSRLKNMQKKDVCKINLFVSKGLYIKDLEKYDVPLIQVKCEKDADVIVATKKPNNTDQMITTCNKIGNKIVQEIWVCANNKPEALDLAEFIILRFHDQ